jgi:hypothetical protein
LTPHYVCIEVLKNALQSQDEWGTVGTFSFDALGPLNLPKNLQKGPLQYLLLKVVAQGPTRVLQIFDRRILQGSERLPASLGSGTVAGRMSGRVPFPAFYVSGAQVGDAISDELRRAPKIVQIDVNIASVGVSLVDHVPQELIYVSVSGIRVKHSLYPQQEITELEVQRLQVDNQLWSTPYPSLLYPLLSNQKFVSLELHRDTRYAGVEFIPLLKFSLSPPGGGVVRGGAAGVDVHGHALQSLLPPAHRVPAGSGGSAHAPSGWQAWCHQQSRASCVLAITTLSSGQQVRDQCG